MSAALLKKSLELCDTPFVVVTDKQEVRYRGLPEQKNPRKTQRGVADVRRENITCIEQVKKKRQQQRKKEANLLKKLELLKQPVIDEKLAKIILESTKKRGAADGSVVYLKEDSKQESIFTEEDFARFAREYNDDS